MFFQSMCVTEFNKSIRIRTRLQFFIVHSTPAKLPKIESEMSLQKRWFKSSIYFYKELLKLDELDYRFSKGEKRDLMRIALMLIKTNER